MEFDEDDNCVGGLVPKFGAIFMSNSATRKECLKRKIFGLPLAKANFVKQVKSGMILFLFEFEKRELYGVFQATSDGTMNLKPHAFTSSGKQFPAQVKIAPIWSCRPLPEVVFRDAIKDNYYSANKFNFGLSAQQVRVLLDLFYSRRLNTKMPPRQIADKMTMGDKLEGKANSSIGLVGADREPLMIEDRYKNVHNIGDSLRADREPFMIEDRYKSVHSIGDGIEPDYLPMFPSYFTSSEDIVLADNYRSSKDDGVVKVCDVESCIKPNFTSGSVSNYALNGTVPYDPDFPDIAYQCQSQILDSSQDFSSHQAFDKDFLPLSTSGCVSHEAALGSLYSEAPVLKVSVFSRLSGIKEENGIHREDDRVASVDDIMESLQQAHSCWVKDSINAKSRFVYVRCKEESKFLNQPQFEQPVVTKEIAIDVDRLVEECDFVPKETRVVDFKRRSKKNKYLDEMVSKVFAGTSETTGEDLPGKKRKLIRPDFRKKQSNESCDILVKLEDREKIDEINSEAGSGANDCGPESSLKLANEYQVNLLIQEIVSSLSSGSSAQEQPTFISGDTAVPKNLEEETADRNHRVGNGDIITLE